MSDATPDVRRRVPRTDAVLAEPRVAAAIERLGPALVKPAVHQAQDRVRRGELSPDALIAAVLAALPPYASSLRPVLNATGVILHTNLGRAALSRAAIEALTVAAGYVDVEFDLADGSRARRGRATIDALLRTVTAAPAAMVVNNGAAALVLAATALAAGKEIIVSRGELVEIGDGFRLPDLLISTGARLREVGTTNRTHLADYQAAIGADTAFILKVHPSNFVQSGFTSTVSVRELAELGVPVVADVGSGLLHPEPALPDEPDVTSWLAAGAALVTASGDKLLGGPQAGLILGRADLVQALRSHPLARALRVDKLVLAALEATLTGPPNPTQHALHASADGLRARAQALADLLAERGLAVAVVPAEGVVGGGGAPGLILPGWAVQLPERLAVSLRLGDPALVTRVEHGHCLLDLRCVAPADDVRVADAVVRATGGAGLQSRPAPCT